MTAGTFQKLMNELPEKVMDKVRVEHKVWIYPASFCFVWNINDARLSTRDNTQETKRLTELGRSCVQFWQSKSRTSPNNSSSPRILSV